MVDGDTIIVDYNGVEETVRLIGVDTPESVHPDASKNTEAGYAASKYTSTFLAGAQVELEFDVQQRDQYGRLLAYVYLDGEMFNKRLLETGYASLATYPPNVKYVDEFTEIVNSRDPSVPSEEYDGWYMKAPAAIYHDSINHWLATVFMYEDGKITEIVNPSNSENSYLTLISSRGNITLIVLPSVQSDLSALKVGDTVRVGFIYSDTLSNIARGYYATTLKRETNESGSASINKTNPANESNSSTKTEPNNRTVYVTKTGKRYHYSSTCNGGTYYASTLSQASARGLTPCNKCVR